MDSKSEQAEMDSKNERNLMDLDDDTHREDQFSSSYETPTVTAATKEPTGVRPKFFEESIQKQRREIERLQELLAVRDQQLNEQGNLINKMKAPFEPAPVTDPTLTLTLRVPRAPSGYSLCRDYEATKSARRGDANNANSIGTSRNSFY
jgi:hypothetical protein